MYSILSGSCPQLVEESVNFIRKGVGKSAEKETSAGTGRFILEKRLDAPEPPPDVSLCITRPEMSRLLPVWQKMKLFPLFRESMPWRRILTFCRSWFKGKSPVYRNVSDVWLEFDHRQLLTSFPAPCFFFSPVSRNSNGRQFPSLQADSTQWFYRHALGALLEEKTLEKTKPNLDRLIRELPDQGVIFQVGVMLARESDLVRVCTSMPSSGYLDYLRKIHWSGAYDYLEPLLSVLDRYVDAVFLDLDVGGTVQPAVGIECSFKGLEMDIPRIKEFLDFLVEMELCGKPNVMDVLDYLSDTNAPVQGFQGWGDLRRGLSHFKIRLEPDGSAQAKVYLSLSEKSD